MKPTVFIHTNAPQLLGAKVAAYALNKMSSNSERFDVKILQLEDYPHLTKREGSAYRRKGQTVTWHNRDLQSFTPLRFLPPQCMGYQGRAVVIDPDVFARADVWELLNRDMEGKAIFCRYVTPDDGRPPFYGSSVLLLDCAKLTHWRWDEQIDELFDQRWDYGDWVALRREPPESIGHLEEEWNHFDTLNERTKMLHTTERLTQPWKTGLPIDFNLNYSRGSSRSGVRGMLGAVRQRLAGSPKSDATTPGDGHYQQNPDPAQERFFFTLLHESLEAGMFDEDFLRSEIEQRHLRPDAFEVLAGMTASQR